MDDKEEARGKDNKSIAILDKESQDSTSILEIVVVSIIILWRKRYAKQHWKVQIVSRGMGNLKLGVLFISLLI
jgi:hypothetical protein